MCTKNLIPSRNTLTFNRTLRTLSFRLLSLEITQYMIRSDFFREKKIRSGSVISADILLRAVLFYCDATCVCAFLYTQVLGERIIWPVCLLVRVTIRGIRNLVSSLPSIEATIRGHEDADTCIRKR